MDKYIGRLLDNRYEVLEVLGTGGMAVVYKARCHRLNRLVAIKILKDDYLEDEEFRRRFHSESQAVAMLSHPNIVSIYDVSSSVTADYIVMELIDGITLKQYMEKKGVLNWKETLHFAIQIAKALEHAHGRGIVHRDIKPHNVMVLKNGSVKVTDFGIARMMSKGNTLTKEALGSVHYISPEQAKGGRVDSRSDLYSLGVVMYEMMSGRPPYDGESPVAVAIQHINGGAVLPSTLNPNIPGGLEQIIMKAMAHDPAQRFESATEMLRDMDEFRKHPSILFDYNIPPIDEVTRLRHDPIIFEAPEPTTTAEHVERSADADRKKRPPQGRGAPRTGGRQGQRSSGTSGTWPPERRPSSSRKKKSGNAAAIAVIACSVTIILALIVFFVIQFSGSDNLDLVKVPDLVGEDYELHKEHSDFDIKINERVYHDEYPAGVIIYQTPVAGSEVQKNTTIHVNVSLGKQLEPEYMPDLADWDLDKAESKLQDIGIEIEREVIEEYNETIAQGRVIRTEPNAGTELVSGMKVKIYVSLGVEIVSKPMPSGLLDRTADEAEAILLAMDLNLNVKKVPEYSSTVEEGNIIRIEPEGTTVLKTNDTVTIVYSQGPKFVEMPDLVNKTISDVPGIMQPLGLLYTFDLVESDLPAFTVVGQSVPAGDQVDVSELIRIHVSSGTGSSQVIKKDVVIDLKDSASQGDCEIVVYRDNAEIYRATVPQGTTTLTIPDQIGSGVVVYGVNNGHDFWEQEVTFDER